MIILCEIQEYIAFSINFYEWNAKKYLRFFLKEGKDPFIIHGKYDGCW